MLAWSNTTRPLLVILALLASVCSAGVAVAAEPTATQIREAAEAFDRGREAYRKQDWVTAAEQFERAHSHAASATALEYSIRSRDKAGQLDRAATLAALALKRYPDEAGLSKLATGVLDRSRDRLFELSVSCSEPCDLAVAGKTVPGAPDRQRTVYLSPGKVSIGASFGADRGDSQTVDAEAGEHGQVLFDAPSEPRSQAEEPDSNDEPEEPEERERKPAPRKPAPAEASSGWSPVVFWSGVGVTAALGIATIWSGIDTVNNPGKERVKNECAPGDTSCDLYQQGLAHERRTNVLIGTTAGAGIATIVIGAWLTDWDDSRGEPPPADDPSADYIETAGRHRVRSRAHVEPWLSLGQTTMLGAQGRF